MDDQDSKINLLSGFKSGLLGLLIGLISFAALLPMFIDLAQDVTGLGIAVNMSLFLFIYFLTPVLYFIFWYLYHHGFKLELRKATWQTFIPAVYFIGFLAILFAGFLSILIPANDVSLWLFCGTLILASLFSVACFGYFLFGGFCYNKKESLINVSDEYKKGKTEYIGIFILTVIISVVIINGSHKQDNQSFDEGIYNRGIKLYEQKDSLKTIEKTINDKYQVGLFNEDKSKMDPEVEVRTLIHEINEMVKARQDFNADNKNHQKQEEIETILNECNKNSISLDQLLENLTELKCLIYPIIECKIDTLVLNKITRNLNLSKQSIIDNGFTNIVSNVEQVHNELIGTTSNYLQLDSHIDSLRYSIINVSKSKIENNNDKFRLLQNIQGYLQKEFDVAYGQNWAKILNTIRVRGMMLFLTLILAFINLWYLLFMIELEKKNTHISINKNNKEPFEHGNQPGTMKTVLVILVLLIIPFFKSVEPEKLKPEQSLWTFNLSSIINSSGIVNNNSPVNNHYGGINMSVRSTNDTILMRKISDSIEFITKKNLEKAKNEIINNNNRDSKELLDSFRKVIKFPKSQKTKN
jgi:hypothetical protein